MTAVSFAAVDTDALSYYQAGFAADAADEQVRTKNKIHNYFSRRRSKGGRLILASIVYGEFLSRYEDADWDAIAAVLFADYLIYPFDDAAARTFAELRREKDSIKSYREKSGLSKTCVKADAMIASIALANGATEILTGNGRDFELLTNGKLKVINVATLAEPPAAQLNLFPPDRAT